MNKIFKFAALLSVCLMAFAGCAPEEISTDQFSDDAVTFAAFAPNPVARGGALRITGSNLQKVNEVVLPGVDPITEIEVVKEGKYSEIRVIVPVDGPEVGPVSIVADGKTFTSLVDLTYSEPIIFDGFSPAEAMPGDVITIKGDYMNNIKAVQFEGGASVVEFTAQSRYEMKVVVPSAAVTGKIILCDVDENNNPDGLVANMFYSKEELTIGDPTVKAADRGMLKAGAEITVQGEYLDMIAKAAFRVTTPAAEEGAEPTVVDTEVDFTLAEDHKSVKVALPTTVVEGEIILTSFAGKDFKAGTYTTVVPTGLAIAAETRYKAGLSAVVTGKDLDLVTKAELAGTALEFAYADGKITFAIPAAAVDGTVALTLANGKTVETEAIELVKPVITSMTPLELYAGDENIIVSGEDLDLVTGATLGGRDAEFEYADGTVIVKTALTSVSGKVALSLANGVVVESADEVKVNYHSLVIVTEMPQAQHIGMEVVLKGSNYDLVENIFIGEEKVTKYLLRTPDEVRFIMPWNKVGMYNISFHLFSGDVETVATPIEVQLELQTIVLWEGDFTIGSWNGNQDLAYGAYDWSQAKPGDILQIIGEPVNPDAGWWCLSLRVGNEWKNLNGVPGQYDNCTSVEVKLTKEIIDHLVDQSGLILTGQDYKFSKISLIREISQETTLWEGEVISADWGGMGLLSDAGLELQEAGATAGQVIYFYIEPLVADWQLKIIEGHWGPTYLAVCASAENTGDGEFTPYDLAANGGKVALTLTQEMLDTALTQQWWGNTFLIQGNNVKCTKITLL